MAGGGRATGARRLIRPEVYSISNNNGPTNAEVFVGPSTGDDVDIVAKRRMMASVFSGDVASVTVITSLNLSLLLSG